ncbi:YncE family protein [Streptomyces sp. NPDC058321]|uniref:YncE family protein n=1 Tax=Streptomyces sp. NPDC058321 TaxID=3346445 RepID=UPI0036E43C3E
MERTSLVELPRRHRPEVQKAHQGVARLLSHVRMWMLALVVATAGGILPAAVATPAAARAAVDTIPVGDNPLGVTVSRDGTRLYAGNLLGNSVSVINTITNSVVTTVPAADGPGAVTASPTKNRLYVVHGGSGTVTEIDSDTYAVIRTVPVGDSPGGVAVSPDGKSVYVTSQNDDTVTAIAT